MNLAEVGDSVVAAWQRDPEETVALVRELAVGSEFTADEVLREVANARLRPTCWHFSKRGPQLTRTQVILRHAA